QPIGEGSVPSSDILGCVCPAQVDAGAFIHALGASHPGPEGEFAAVPGSGAVSTLRQSVDPQRPIWLTPRDCAAVPPARARPARTATPCRTARPVVPGRKATAHPTD